MRHHLSGRNNRLMPELQQLNASATSESSRPNSTKSYQRPSTAPALATTSTVERNPAAATTLKSMGKHHRKAQRESNSVPVRGARHIVRPATALVHAVLRRNASMLGTAKR